MATISFTKEFSVSKKNSVKFLKALSSSKQVDFSSPIKASDVKKCNILEFFEETKK